LNISLELPPETGGITYPFEVIIEEEKSPLESSCIAIDCNRALCKYKI
jgi:hypothetical protein